MLFRIWSKRSVKRSVVIQNIYFVYAYITLCMSSGAKQRITGGREKRDPQKGQNTLLLFLNAMIML